MFDHIGTNIMSILGLSKGKQTEKDMSHFESLTQDQKSQYQAQFEAIKDSDINTNSVGSWTSPLKRSQVLTDIGASVKSYFASFAHKVSGKTEEIRDRAMSLKNDGTVHLNSTQTEKYQRQMVEESANPLFRGAERLLQ